MWIAAWYRRYTSKDLIVTPRKLDTSSIDAINNLVHRPLAPLPLDVAAHKGMGAAWICHSPVISPGRTMPTSVIERLEGA